VYIIRLFLTIRRVAELTLIIPIDSDPSSNCNPLAIVATSANVALFANFATSAISAISALLAEVAEPALSAYAIEQSVLSVPPFITW